MYVNQDKDLQCIICAKILVTEIQFEYDSRAGKIRDNKKKKFGGYLDEDSGMVGSGVRGSNTQNNHTKMVRQKSLGTGRRTLSKRRRN